MTSGCTGGSNASLLVPGEFGVSPAERSALFQQLDSFDPGKRKRAAKVLGKIEPATNSYISSLLHVIEDSSHPERIAAVNKVGECATHLAETTDLLCRTLKDTKPRVRAAAAHSLRRMVQQLSAAIQPLEQVTATPVANEGNDLQELITSAEKARGDLLTQINKIEQALALYSDKSCPLIEEGFGDEVNTDEMVSLAETPDQHAEPRPDPDTDADAEGIPQNPYDNAALTPELQKEIDALDGFSARKRRLAPHAIERMCSDNMRAIPEHVSLLGNRNSYTTAGDSIEAIALDLEVVVSALCRSMQDLDDKVCIHSATALGTIAGALAVTVAPLEAAIEDTNRELNNQTDMSDGMLLETSRQSCEKALKRVHEILEKSVTALTAKRDTPSYDVRNAAAEAIKKITFASTAPDARPRKNEKTQMADDGDDSDAEIAALPYDEKKIKLLLLMQDLEHPYVSIGKKAARELGDMGPEAAGAVQALIKAIRNTSNWYPEYHYVIEESVRALGKIGPPAESAIPVLMESLDDHHYTAIQGEAALSLGLIGKDAETVVPKLLNLLDHAHATPVKAAVSEALGYFPSSPYSGTCYRKLLNLLEKSSGKVHLNAFKSLSLYEAQNRGTGLVKWAPLKGYVTGYLVFLKTKTGEFVTCIDTRMETVINLGQFPQFQKDAYQIKVMARRGSAVLGVPWTHVDVEKILTEATASEKDPEVKAEKKSALALLKAEMLSQGGMNEALPDLMTP